MEYTGRKKIPLEDILKESALMDVENLRSIQPIVVLLTA